MRNTNVDHIWRTLGPLGKYQCKQMGSYLLSLIAWAFQGLNIVFIGHRPDFQCRPSNNDSMVNNITDIHKEYQQCMIVTYTNTSDGVFKSSSPCDNGWEYDAPVDQSFVTEWNFVCENAELGELTQVLYLVGMMIGTFIFPTLSDRFGRKPIMVMGHVTVFGVSLATAFSGNYVVFVILRFLAGFCQQGLLAGTTLSLETLPAEIRHYCEVLALLCWTSSICLMSPIAYALRNFPWKYLQITYAMCSAWSIFQWWFTDESLRWVIANGQIGRAKEIIKNACKWNGKDYTEVMEKIGWGGLLDADSKLVIMTDYNSEKEQTALGPLTADIDEHNIADNHQTALNQINSNAQAARGPLVRQNGFERSDSEPEVVDEVSQDNDLKVQKYTIFDIFRHKRILIVSMIMWYSWICDSFVYFGLYMTSSDLYGDRYLNFFLSAAVEYFSAFIEYLCLARIGRKWTAIIGHIIAAVGLAVATGLTYTAGNR
ncbi:organic anion transporter 3-like isoform X2 [Ruditapes philippinarum]|uniref:organic anion transporter 3-like isoform X1 n=1 Tax=Ruditapes philippinarum TaxID=129788 RepID=UPI00295A778D|nr:organic anion transporter 3-like isoform X1 [Ruditapes philippinarum]XP_060574450.1 organic anion transporter 3-like isoform X2 [Ruditapes philippinarum]